MSRSCRDRRNQSLPAMRPKCDGAMSAMLYPGTIDIQLYQSTVPDPTTVVHWPNLSTSRHSYSACLLWDCLPGDPGFPMLRVSMCSWCCSPGNIRVRIPVHECWVLPATGQPVHGHPMLSAAGGTVQSLPLPVSKQLLSVGRLPRISKLPVLKL